MWGLPLGNGVRAFLQALTDSFWQHWLLVWGLSLHKVLSAVVSTLTDQWTGLSACCCCGLRFRACGAEASLTASAAHLHLDELLVVVFTKVVHQLHGVGLPTGASRALGGILNGATDVVPQCLLTTGCTLENCRPAAILKLMHVYYYSCQSMLHAINTVFDVMQHTPQGLLRRWESRGGTAAISYAAIGLWPA